MCIKELIGVEYVSSEAEVVDARYAGHLDRHLHSILHGNLNADRLFKLHSPLSASYRVQSFAVAYRTLLDRSTLPSQRS